MHALPVCTLYPGLCIYYYVCMEYQSKSGRWLVSLPQLPQLAGPKLWRFSAALSIWLVSGRSGNEALGTIVASYQS
jgi:hypothetical protein